MENVEKKTKLGMVLAYLFLTLPFVIFALGWMKVYIAIPVVLVILVCFLKMCKEAEAIWIPDLNKKNIIKIISIIGIVCIWVYFSGIGKFVFQNEDHNIRNGLFNMLVESEWPVIGQNDHGETRALIYYIGYWLPSALIGKVFGLGAGYFAQAIWAVLGILLVYYFICVYVKKIVVWPLFIFIFFSGWDIVGQMWNLRDTLSYIYPTMHLEWWGTPYQFSSMTTQLFWVFNQSIPIWLATMLLCMQKNNRNLVFIISTTLITSTFPFVGTIPLVVYFALTGKNKFTKKEKFMEYLGQLIKDTCTLQNVVAGGIIGIMTFLYLKGNIAGRNVGGSVETVAYYENDLRMWVKFIILDVGVFAILLWKYHIKNVLFYLVIATLMIVSPIQIGYSMDFCMRASIPALFVLMLMVMQGLEKAWKEKNRFILIGLILTLLIGAVTPFFEMGRTVVETVNRRKNNVRITEVDSEELEIFSAPNFSGEIEDNFFFESITK